MNSKDFIKTIVGMNTIKVIKSWLKGANEKELIRERRAFYLQFLSLSGIFFDIGANYGSRLEPLINDEVKIVAVEPQRECVRFLKRKFGKKITILQNGVGSKSESKTMYISTNANILSSFSKEWIDSTKQSGRFKSVNWNTTRTIEMITLDYLIANYGTPDFVKIDVEGFELEVLKGLSQPVKALSLEYTVPERKDALVDCLNYLNMLYSGEISFNYCASESVIFAAVDWLNYEEVIKLVNTSEFLGSQFGDIYIKYTGKY